jgi:hypothetical protein
MRFLQDPADGTGSSYRDLLSIDWRSKRIQVQVPAFRFGVALKSCSLQPCARTRIVAEDTHQVVTFRDAEVEDAGSKRADSHALKQSTLSHATYRMQNQLVCNTIFISMR